MTFRIAPDFVDGHNAMGSAALVEDYAALARLLLRRGIDVEAIVAKVIAFAVAIPTWGVGTGGTRFARFPGVGEPRNIFD